MWQKFPSGLPDAIRRLVALRRSSEALRQGAYWQLTVTSEQLSFSRQVTHETVVVAVNGAASEATMALQFA
jgi:hypothetical protein